MGLISSQPNSHEISSVYTEQQQSSYARVHLSANHEPQFLDIQLDVCIQLVANQHLSEFLTVELRSEAETVITLILLVPVAIVTHTSGGVLAATLVSGMRDRVLD